jgi:GIY-YIG catalytic domain
MKNYAPKQPLVLREKIPLFGTKFRHYRTCCGIYVITNEETGRVYVGSSINVIARWHGHRGKSGQSYRTPRLFGGTDITVAVLEICQEQDLWHRECFWIDFYKACDPQYGYNTSIRYKRGGRRIPAFDDDGVCCHLI